MNSKLAPFLPGGTEGPLRDREERNSILESIVTNIAAIFFSSLSLSLFLSLSLYKQLRNKGRVFLFLFSIILSHLDFHPRHLKVSRTLEYQ